MIAYIGQVLFDRDAHYRETFTQSADILETNLPIKAAEAIQTSFCFDK